MIRRIFVVLAALAVAGLGAGAFAVEGEDPDAAEAKAAEQEALRIGKKVFEDEALGTNDRACATCHDNPKKPELTLKGVHGRFPRWDRNAGRVITLQEKFAQMQERSLKTRKPLPLGDERWTALEVYLKSLR